MPRRNMYGLKRTTVNLGSMFEFLSCGYMEVAPGETITGSVNVNVQSAPVKRNIKTRTYLDAYAFYCPFRS